MVKLRGKSGGGLVGTVANGALWYEASKNSDGTVVGTIGTRLWYGFLILLIPASLIALFFLFAKKTPMAPKSEHFAVSKKDKKKSKL